MEAEHRKMLIDALEAAFAEIGHDLYTSMTQTKNLLDRHYPMIDAGQSRERLDALFASYTTEDDARVGQFAMLVSAMPRIANQFIEQAIVEAAEKMPPEPSGRREIEPEIKRKIIETVGRLHTQGVAIGLAQSRAAQQFGLGKRSVQRVWQQRQIFAEQPFQTMSDVWKFLSSP